MGLRTAPPRRSRPHPSLTARWSEDPEQKPSPPRAYPGEFQGAFAGFPAPCAGFPLRGFTEVTPGRAVSIIAGIASGLGGDTDDQCAKEPGQWKGRLPATLLELTSNTRSRNRRSRAPDFCPSLCIAALPGEGFGGDAVDDP